VKRAITGRARANTGDVEESINSPESFQARSNRFLNCKLIADIGCSEACFTQACGQGTAFLLVDPNDKHRVFGRP
jgi:hypothetical protein